MESIGVVGLQWGDEGKGKIVDFLAQHFDIVTRFQGGNNAGHTVIIGDTKYKLSILPSGILRKGVVSVIGGGVVIDPVQLLTEVRLLQTLNISINDSNLMVSDNCHLVINSHKLLDKNNSKIGTTLRGIGPCYEDKVARRGIRICDLQDKDSLFNKLKSLIEHHTLILNNINSDLLNEIYTQLLSIAPQILQYARSPYEIKKFCHSKRILCEGAQGALLDIDFGTYPFVTSSSTFPGQIVNGSGINYPSKVLGVVKAYCTRVGEGPFPTEEKGEIGELLRKKGNEVGTITNRARRCGWFDAVLVRQMAYLSNVDQIILTKLDILDNIQELKVCVAYDIEGKIYDHLPTNLDLQSKIKPIYQILTGWEEITYSSTSLEQLPFDAQNYIKFIEEFINIPIIIVSTGPERDQIINIKSLN